METSKYEIAKKRVEAKRKFRSHLMVYVLVNAFLFGINIFGSMDQGLWFIYPMLGWGIGLGADYYKAYIKPNWEDHALKRELDKLEAPARSIFDEKDRLELNDLPETEKVPDKKWTDSDLV